MPYKEVKNGGGLTRKRHVIRQALEEQDVTRGDPRSAENSAEMLSYVGSAGTPIVVSGNGWLPRTTAYVGQDQYNSNPLIL